MKIFCPYAAEECIHQSLEDVDCPNCVWLCYGHASDDVEDIEDSEDSEDFIKEELFEDLTDEEIELSFYNYEEDESPLDEDELPY